MEIRKLTVNTSLLIGIVLVILGVVLRLIPHIPNFAPIGAIALFSGAILSRKIALWLPLVVMLISDIVLGFYQGIGFTWMAFILVAVFGMILSRKGFFTRISLGVLGTGIIFFVVSNFGVWLTGDMYSHTWAGLVQCYYMGIPFFRMTFLSDVFFSVMLFGSYEVVMHMIRKPFVTIYFPLPILR